MSLLETKLEEWNHIDSLIKTHTEKLNILKNKKKEISDELLELDELQQHEESTTIANLPDGKIKLVKTKITQSLTFNYLENCLNEIISSPEQVSTIIEHIKTSRKIDYVTELKRIYNK